MPKMNFIIPGLYEQCALNILTITLLRAHPEYFYDNVEISSVFGNFQFCTWDGGRIFPNYYYASREFIERLKYIYNEELGVSMRFIFTAPNILEEECFDRYNNLVLSICEDEMNEIVVNSPLLENYIRKHYPKYKFISSTTKCLNNTELARRELQKEEYSLVCLDYNLNKNKNFLNSLTKEEKLKAEFLVNSICQPGCPQRKKHYFLNGEHGKTYGKKYVMNDCLINHGSLYPRNYSHNFSNEEIKEYYENGFSYFKLEGRNFADLEAVLNLVKYLIKPEYIYCTISYLYGGISEFDISDYSFEVYKDYKPW